MKSNVLNLLLLSICTLIFLSACATRLDKQSPAGTDLSGHWVIDKEASQNVFVFAGRSNRQNGSMGGGMGGQRNSEDIETGQRRAGGPALTPAMKTNEMTIEQNHDSMGVEYPGEMYRDVDWGKKDFFRETVTAGWQDNSLIVKTASDQMTITETYQLNSSQDVLTQTISIKGRNGTNEFIRVFDLQK